MTILKLYIMRRNILRLMLSAAAIAAITPAALGQNLEESVTVEGKYSPDYIPADRLPLLPSAIALPAPESRMEYDRRGVAADFAPDALSMTATGWRATKNYDDSRGYVALSLGSWLNASLSAGYTAIKTDATTLGVRLQHNSTSLWKAWTDKAGLPDADTRRRYDETIGADLRHSFGDAGTLSAGVQYHLGYFNYYSATACGEKDGHFDAPTQTLNDASIRLRWSGPSKGKLLYSASADFRHFGYRAAYTPVITDHIALAYGKGERESTLNIGGDLFYRLGGDCRIGTGLLYSGVFNAIGNNVNRVQLTPGYDMTGKDYTLHVGVNLAVASAEKTRFRIAPDVRLDIRKGLCTMTAAVGGGTYLRTLAWMHQMDYYSNPAAGCTEAAYSPIDARLGAQLNPGGKWTAGIEASWRTVLDETLGGTYALLLNGIYGYEESRHQADRIHGFSLALNAGYEFCRYFGLKARATWQPQHGTVGVLNGFDRPVFTLDARAESHPTDRLTIGLDYGLRACRVMMDGNYCDLSLRGEYRVTDRLAVGAELMNLLNRKQQLLPGLPLEGITATAGIQMTF